ncbi:MAG: ABC transporter ATP-binding protein [Lachnospiraceae bacterium]|nr:ABC transporter ATP-binding protein [Lachnospiraceae bacterium]
MNTKSLQAEKINAGYCDKKILKDVSLNIPEKKISVILGSNGSGKSTLLKTFCRLIPATEGQITLDGKALKEYKSKELAKHIGLLPQNNYAPEGIKVAELVSRGRFPHRKLMGQLTKKDYKAIKDAMEAMKITNLADKNVDELSGGQRQRVFIAMALAQETDILFLDEPTTYLDIAYQIEILDMLKELNIKKKLTIIMVLHDINLSAKYADYLFAMNGGRLIKEGTPDEVIDSKTIKEIYGIDSVIMEDPLSHTPMVVPVSAHDVKASKSA